MIEFTIIEDLPRCTSLLNLDSTLILLDPGCDALLSFNEDSLPQKPDIIMLSHADLVHLGGYVYGYKYLGWNTIPVYASLPVVNMGRTTMYDALRSVYPDKLSMTDVDDAFDWITSLRYSQATQLSGKCQGITITAHNAGHTLGGAIWKISRGSDQIVYAIDWNHVRDNHLNGTAMFSGGTVAEGLSRPSLLITDANNASALVAPRSQRNVALLNSLSTTINSGGSVLIPIDASSRSLELCEMFEKHWTSTPALQSVPVYFLSHSNIKTLGYARSMLEWMSEKMINEYGSSGGLFDFKYLKLLSRPSQINSLPAGPKVILATSHDLESGYSQSFLLSEIHADPANLIVLSQKTTYDRKSLAGELLQVWQAETIENANDVPEYISLDIKHTVRTRRQVPLSGQELKDYLKEEQAKKEEELARNAIEVNNRNILEADNSDSEDEEERAVIAGSGTLTGRGPGAMLSLGSSALLNTTFDLHLENPQVAKLPARLKMFPFVERRRRFDDYGEILRADEFKHADEDITEAETVNAVTKAVKGKKRKWGEIAARTDQDSDRVEDDSTVPSKLEVSEAEIHLKCRLRYIDMEGLHDGRSLINIVQSVNPRKLVVVHGTEKDKEELRSACEQLSGFTKEIAVPQRGINIEVSLDTNAYDVQLSDAFAASLHWQRLYEQEVAQMVGKLLPQPEAHKSEYPVLDILSSKADVEGAPRMRALFVGDIRLADLRRHLIDKGHNADLRVGGVLFVDGCVAVTKASVSEVQLEGNGKLEVFASVRESIYNSLALIN